MHTMLTLCGIIQMCLEMNAMLGTCILYRNIGSKPSLLARTSFPHWLRIQPEGAQAGLHCKRGPLVLSSPVC
jgi:hypothetical protein